MTEVIHRRSSIDNDDLLIEIFVRLPYKSADTFRSVSKHWYSLLSHPFFGFKFLNYKQQHMHENKIMETKHLPWTMVVTISNLMPQTSMFDYFAYWLSSNERVFQSRDFTQLQFLPNPNNYCNKMKIVSTFKDLILCFSVNKDMERSYIVCNPISKQWVALPPSPLLPLYGDKDVIEPFTYMIFDDTNTAFRVVIVHPPSLCDYDDPKTEKDNYFSSIIFSSESGNWKQVNLIVPTLQTNVNVIHLPFQGAVCQGLLCLYHGYKFASFDPFDTSPDYITAKSVLPIYEMHHGVTLTQCAGKLLGIRTHILEPRSGFEGYGLHLRHYTCGLIRWYRSTLDENTNTNTNANELAEVWKALSVCFIRDDCAEWPKLFPSFTLIGVHPKNRDLVHIMLNDGQVVLFNLETKRLERSLRMMPTRLPRYTRRSSHRLELQRWPTPIPEIKQFT